MTNVTFFATRTLARNEVRDNGGKFKDFGSDAPTGKRWGVIGKPAPAPAAAEKAATRVASKSSKKTKKAAAVALIKNLMSSDVSRGDILKHLQNNVGLTPGGASTYYANVKNGTWN